MVNGSLDEVRKEQHSVGCHFDVVALHMWSPTEEAAAAAATAEQPQQQN